MPCLRTTMAGTLILMSIGFTPLNAEIITLDKSITIAMKNSIQLHRLKSKIAVSRKLIHERWRDFFPNTSFKYQKDDEVAYREEDVRSHSLLFNMSYDIYSGGRSIITYQLARLESRLAESKYRIERKNIILNVKKTFYNLQKKQQEININRKLLQNLLMQKRIVTEQQKLGMATSLQQVQVDAKISEARYSILTSEDEYSNSKRDFANLLGLPSDRDISIPAPGYTVDSMSGLPGKKVLVARGIKKRHEVQESRFTLLKTEKERALAEYYYLPKIQLFGSYGYTGEDFPLTKKTWTIGISVTTALFGNSMEGGQTFGEKDNGNTRTSSRSGSVQVYDDPSYSRKIVEARSSYAEAVKSHEQLKRSIANEISRAYDNLVQSIERIELAKQNIGLLQKQVQIENEKVRLGEITRHDVLRTYIELNQAELRLQTAITDHHLALAALENAAGVPVGTLEDQEGN